MPRLALPDVVLRTVARQLGGPSGRLGELFARLLNKGNRPTITAATEALGLTGGETVADVGFGGGLGLDLLLAAVGESGTVHGIEPSADMLERARKQRSEAVANGRLVLHEATMDALPLADGSLDGWISLNTIYFIEDLAPAFADLARVLSPSGSGVLGVADPDWLASQPFAKHGFTVRTRSCRPSRPPGWRSSGGRSPPATRPAAGRRTTCWSAGAPDPPALARLAQARSRPG
jgi:arsenite methyltransferase